MLVSQYGGLAQLARAPALQAGGHRFDSDILHKESSLKEVSIGVTTRSCVGLRVRNPGISEFLVIRTSSLTYWEKKL